MFSAKKLTGRFPSPKLNIQTKNLSASSDSSDSSFFSSPKEEERHNQRKKSYEAMQTKITASKKSVQLAQDGFFSAATKSFDDEGPSFYFPGDDEAFQELLEQDRRSAATQEVIPRAF